MVVLYEKAMAEVIKIPMAEGDIIALHEKTLKALLAGMPDRLKVLSDTLMLPCARQRHHRCLFNPRAVTDPLHRCLFLLSRMRLDPAETQCGASDDLRRA